MPILRKKSAFTLVEIMAVTILFAMVSGVVYKLLSGTWGNFYKSQTKLTNLRSASLLLEYLKHDIRMAVIPSDNPTNRYKLTPTGSDLDLQFETSDGTGENVVQYTYTSSSGKVERKSRKAADLTWSSRNINLAKVAAFEVSEQPPTAPQFLKILIKVDADKDEKARTTTSAGNQVTLEAILFPRFFKNYADPEEKYWNYARNAH